MTTIHVNRHHIGLNDQDSGARPVFVVTRDGVATQAQEVRVLGASRLVYDPTQRLADGATAWIETDAPVEVVV